MDALTQLNLPHSTSHDPTHHTQSPTHTYTYNQPHTINHTQSTTHNQPHTINHPLTYSHTHTHTINGTHPRFSSSQRLLNDGSDDKIPCGSAIKVLSDNTRPSSAPMSENEPRGTAVIDLLLRSSVPPSVGQDPDRARGAPS